MNRLTGTKAVQTRALVVRKLKDLQLTSPLVGSHRLQVASLRKHHPCARAIEERRTTARKSVEEIDDVKVVNQVVGKLNEGIFK